MQKIILLLFVVFTLLIGVSGCKKETTVLDYPNVLLKVDLTPGEDENQIAVFLYTSRALMDYEVTEKGDNFLILKLNNTVKVVKTTELSIDGIDELVENVRLIQDIQEKNKKNPFITKLIFKTLNPDVELKIISQIKKIDPQQIQEKIDETPAAQVLAENMHPKSNKIDLGIVIGFWVISLIGIAAYLINKKIIQKKETPVKTIIDTEDDSTEETNNQNNQEINPEIDTDSKQ